MRDSGWMASVLLCLVCVSALAADAGKPVMVIAEDAWDFGTLDQGQTATKDIPVKNEGTANLEIKYVRSSCPTCVGNVSGAEAIPPGKTGKVVLTVYSKGLEGKVERVVYVHGNDPDTPYKAIRVTGTVVTRPQPVIKVEPETLDAGLVVQGKAVTRVLVIRNAGKAPLEIKGIVCSEACSVTDSPKEALKPGEEAKISVALDGAKVRGLVQESVTLQTNDPLAATKTVLLVGYAVGSGTVPALENALVIQPVGDPVKLPGAGHKVYRIYKVTNLLPFPVAFSLADEKPISLSSGQAGDIEVPAEMLNRPLSVKVQLPAGDQ